MRAQLLVEVLSLIISCCVSLGVRLLVCEGHIQEGLHLDWNSSAFFL